MSGVLVTGANGFTGKHLCSALALQGYDVHGISRGDSTANCMHNIDLANIEALVQILQDIRPQYVCHLAAIAHVVNDSPLSFYETNVLGTLNLLQAIDQANVTPKKIVIASSANIYGNPQKSIIDELTPALPINHYGNSKLAMENMVQTWFQRLPIIITRPFNYTGPGQSEQFLIPKIVKHFVDKKSHIQLGNIDVVRDISDVQAIVTSYIKLLGSDVAGSIVNLCSGVGHSIKDVIIMMEHITGHTLKITVNPAFIRANDIKQLIGSNLKLKSFIDVEPPTPMKEVLTKMYAVANA